jgi:hypothetical protein
MEGGEGLLAPFGLGFTPHVQRKAHTDLRLRSHPIDVALHLAIAPIAAFHRIGRRGEQRIIEKRRNRSRGHVPFDTPEHDPGNSVGYRTGWDEAE